MSDPVAAAAKLTDDAIDSELSLAVMGYDPRDEYPEWSNGSMRFAYRSGFEDGFREALKPIRDELDKLAKATEPPCNWEIWTEAYAEAIDRISHHCFSTEEMTR